MVIGFSRRFSNNSKIQSFQQIIEINSYLIIIVEIHNEADISFMFNNPSLKWYVNTPLKLDAVISDFELYKSN